jgi:hypothetical protein
MLWASTLFGVDERNIIENAWNAVGIQPETITLQTAFMINKKYRGA